MTTHIFRAGLLTLALAFSLSGSAQTTVVDVPATGTATNYQGFRAPLHQAPLLKLPVGAVQPEGWLEVFMERQRDGLNGQLGTISSWLDKNNNQWLSNSGDHGWEEVPYWLRGYCSLAYILNDEAMKKEAKVWFDAVLKNQGADGFLGPKNYDNGRVEIWAQMIMLRALQTYYEFTQDNRVLPALTKFFHWVNTQDDATLLEGYWEKLRVGDIMGTVLWTYNQTGDEELLSLLDKLHKNSADWTQRGTLPNWHGVNVAQGFREPAEYYMYKQDPELLQNTYSDFYEMRARYGQMPGGMYAADENARQGYFDPRQGTETCAFVEQMMSDEILMGMTGDPFWADHCENVALNSYTAALMPDMRSLRYLTAANQAISDEKLHGPSIDNNLRGMLSMSPFSSRCCQHNHGMGWPYYTEHLVMATTDGGLATMLYAPSETTAKVADGRTVKLSEETHYPFNGTVNLKVETDEKVTFPLYLRIPSWAKDAVVKVNGKKQSVASADGKYVRINREWKDGDRVELLLPMSVSMQTWQQNKASVSVNYGPLTLSLKIGTEAEQHDSRDKAFVQDDSHWQAGVDASLWPCFVLKPTTKWNYALKLDADGMPAGFSVKENAWPADDFPFTPEASPLEFTAVGHEVPSWGYDATGMTDQLPTKWAQQSSVDTPLTLIPMGTTRLRISAFPVAR